MFANIFQPLIDVAEAILRFYHDTIGVGWGFAIVMLTITVRLAILPLTFKQVRSMQAMQRLQPEMKKLQQRYKDDRQRMNQELMKLYQEHQVNPLGSCLPLVLQLPFFLSLFYLQQSEGFRALVRDTGGSLGVLSGGGSDVAARAVEGGEKFLFIPDLTVPPTGGVLIALILIYICTQLGSSTVSAMAMTDKNQKRLMFALPFIFVPFIVNFPAGLLVYWCTTNVFTIGQQLLVRKVLPPPHLKDKEGHEIELPPEEERPKGLSGMLASIRESAGLAPEDLEDGKRERGAKTRDRGAARTGGRSGARSGGGGAKTRGGAKAGSGTKAGSGSKAGSGTKAGGSGKASGSTKAGRGAKAAGGSKGRADGARADAKAEKKASGDGGNGGPRKAPPPSPRKKKKRSGRRR
jgi:YidC/Oxa1 family membrane protein insertase